MRSTESLRRGTALVSIGAVALALVTACTGGTDDGPLDGGDAPRLTGSLVSFDSCDEALSELQDKALEYLETSGGGREYATEDNAAGSSEPSAAKAEDGTEYSGTNVHEKGVDEPDTVKTDGERIVSVSRGRLYVVDADSEEFTGSVRLGTGEDYGDRSQLLLHGDRVLVVSPYARDTVPAGWKDDDKPVSTATTLTLVDLSEDEPEVVNDFTIDGGFVDARAIDGMSRIVISTSPRLPYQEPGLFESHQDARADAITDSEIGDWLPRYRVDGEDKQVPCRSLARPSEYSADSMLTILSFDLAKRLDEGAPLSLEADGETVYGTADALYVANNRSEYAAQEGARSSKSSTELYRFGLGSGASVTFESAGKVPGFLLNQYSMSEWDGYLRVATTSSPNGNSDGGQERKSSSSVYVLEEKGKKLKQVGKVGGLGKGERIKSVRYIEDTAYVVTFRQTDPLYTVDLSNPRKPETVGELKIPGYSAYLHPVSGDRLIGVGRDGTDSGAITGAQVSLFDVSDDSDPTQLDKYSVDSASSGVEFDPHAFLYWPDKELVVVPVNDNGGTGSTMRVLTIGDEKLTEAGVIEHDGADHNRVDRSIVIGTALWTISDAGMLASDIDSLDEREWLSFT